MSTFLNLSSMTPRFVEVILAGVRANCLDPVGISFFGEEKLSFLFCVVSDGIPIVGLNDFEPKSINNCYRNVQVFSIGWYSIPITFKTQVILNKIYIFLP